MEGYPVLLTYGKYPGWGKLLSNMNRTPAQQAFRDDYGDGPWLVPDGYVGDTLEEYPFASTREGGLGAYVWPARRIPYQRDQGIQLSRFLRANHMKTGGHFVVLVVSV